MEKAYIDAFDTKVDSATVRRSVADAINATNVALNYYELAPGDSFAYGYHTHENQKELFVIQQGQATFETEDGDVVVEAGEVIRFASSEYQRGSNRGDDGSSHSRLERPERWETPRSSVNARRVTNARLTRSSWSTTVRRKSPAV